MDQLVNVWTGDRSHFSKATKDSRTQGPVSTIFCSLHAQREEPTVTQDLSFAWLSTTRLAIYSAGRDGRLVVPSRNSYAVHTEWDLVGVEYAFTPLPSASMAAMNATMDLFFTRSVFVLFVAIPTVSIITLLYIVIISFPFLSSSLTF